MTIRRTSLIGLVLLLAAACVKAQTTHSGEALEIEACEGPDDPSIACVIDR